MIRRILLTLTAVVALSGLPTPATAVEYLPAPELGTTTSQGGYSIGGKALPSRPEEIEETSMSITIPDVYQTTLSNQIRFYHYEARDLPRVRLSMIIRAGEYHDPADKVGLADITARSLRAGGAEGIAPDDFDRQLEDLGSDLGIAADRDMVSVNMFSLSRNIKPSMELLGKLLKTPQFDAKKFEQQKDLVLENIRRQNDQPSDISRREFRKIIYGVDHPMARTPKAEDIEGIKREDVLDLYQNWYRPASISIGISGDLSREEAQKLVEEMLGSWERPPADKPPYDLTIDMEADTTGGVYLSHKLTAQSQIRLGHIGMPRHSPEIYAANVANGIYGTGGFSSRLMNRVRTKRGFVYGVGGAIFTDEPAGLFAAIAASKSRTTYAAIQEILDVTRELSETPITDEEIEIAKRDSIFSFLTNFDTPHEIVLQYMTYDYRGYAPDYLKTYVDKMRAVTRDEVKDVITKYIHPERIKIYVIGFEKQFDKPLSEFGTVTPWPLDTGEDAAGSDQN